MANYMADVAKLLGVELGEDFKCSDGNTFRLTNNGMLMTSYEYWVSNDEEDYTYSLLKLLNGSIYIVPKPWKPKDGEPCWVVGAGGMPISDVWRSNEASYLNFYKLGNYYRTEEEAIANRGKWIAFYASDEVIEV